jgi:putative nucleotidyltransferase with HDIG domain
MRKADRQGWLSAFLRRHGKLQPRVTGIFLGSLAVTLAIVLASGQFGSLFNFVPPSAYEVGKVAPRDVTVDRDVLYKDAEATRLRQEAVEKLVAPVFRVNQEIGQSKLRQFEEFRSTLSGLEASGEAPDTVFLKLQRSFPGVLQRQELDRLLRRRGADLTGRAKEVLEKAYGTGILRLPDVDSQVAAAGNVELWYWREGRLEKQPTRTEDLLSRERLRSWSLGSLRDLAPEQAQLVARMVEAFAVENVFLDPGETLKAKAKAVEQVEPVLAKLSRDQVIIRKGDLVTEEAAQQLRALSEYSANVSISGIAGNALFVLLLFALCPFLLSRSVVRTDLRRSQLLLLAGLGLSYLALAAVFFNLLEAPGSLPLAVFLPTSALSMLVALLVSTQAASVFSLLASLLLLPILGLDLYSFFYAFTTGVAAAAVAARAERRIDLIRAGIVLSVVSCLALLASGLLKGDFPGVIPAAIGYGIANAFLGSMATLGLLPVFEHMLNTPSRFRLIELSDLNAPLMKQMLSQAPGTYSHSISVANLAESACSAMGANALLARVGAYYHDIGKIAQSEYFIENQDSYNKHDDMKPSLSAAVIRAHVKLGVETARKMDLPAEVRDIIAQHHGRGIIRYFYQRAMEAEEKRDIPSEEYSYPGERPRTREAAVVMLADTAEAASRTLRKPTLARLDRFIWGLIMEKFNSGDLGESALTLADLEIVRRSFVQILAGYFHSRIEYPKAKEAAR